MICKLNERFLFILFSSFSVSLLAPVQVHSARLFGRVRAKPKILVQQDSQRAYEARALGKATLFDYEHLKEVVVYAEPMVAEHTNSTDRLSPEPHKNSHFSVLFERSRYHLEVKPKFVVVPSGNFLTFKNQTPDSLTFYAGGNSANSLSIMMKPKSEEKVQLNKIGLYQLFCLEEPGVESRVFVSSIYFSQTDSKGSYAIELPSGTYRVTAWHPRLPLQAQEIQIQKGEDTHELNFTLSVEQLPEIK